MLNLERYLSNASANLTLLIFNIVVFTKLVFVELTLK